MSEFNYANPFDVIWQKLAELDREFFEIDVRLAVVEKRLKYAEELGQELQQKLAAKPETHRSTGAGAPGENYTKAWNL